MKHLLILISILLLSSPIFGNNHKAETLYQWGKFPNYKWVGFGDKEEHCVYKGQVKNGKPHGVGFLECKEWRLKYIGEFKDGLKHGQGKETTLNFYNKPIDKYEGSWEKGYREGKASFINYYDEYIFVGKFKGGGLFEGTLNTLEGELWCELKNSKCLKYGKQVFGFPRNKN